MEKITLTVAEAAQRLGLGRNKLYALVHARQVPSIRLGKSILIPVKALDQWLEQAAKTT